MRMSQWPSDTLLPSSCLLQGDGGIRGSESLPGLCMQNKSAWDYPDMHLAARGEGP